MLNASTFPLNTSSDFSSKRYRYSPRRLIFLAAVGIAAFLPGLALAHTPGVLHFDVLRNGKPFGFHSVTVSAEGGGLRAQESAIWRVKFGPITAFHFERHCNETWRGGKVQAIGCSTLKDGKTVRVVAKREGAGLVVSAPNDFVLPADTVLSCWWTEETVKASLNGAPMLDTGKGIRSTAQTTLVGEETIVVKGESIRATHYRVTDKFPMDLWYDSAGRWVKSAFVARGSKIEYVLASARADAPT